MQAIDRAVSTAALRTVIRVPPRAQARRQRLQELLELPAPEVPHEPEVRITQRLAVEARPLTRRERRRSSARAGSRRVRGRALDA